MIIYTFANFLPRRMIKPHYPESSTCHYIIIMQKAPLIPAKLICNSNPLIQRADLAMGMLQYGKSHLKRKVRRISRAYGSLLNVPIFLHFFFKAQHGILYVEFQNDWVNDTGAMVDRDLRDLSLRYVSFVIHSMTTVPILLLDGGILYKLSEGAFNPII